MTEIDRSSIFDRALEYGSATERDRLDRKGFAKQVVDLLRRVDNKNGLTVSIEGTWGCGKTSLLSLIQEGLDKSDPKPLVVKFNPWLIGDRDALLGQLLGMIATQLELSDPSSDAGKAATEIKAYVGIFDVMKFIPGAEPWASILKSVVSATGDAAQNYADSKSRDIKLQRDKVAEALAKLSRPIVVMIDDIDRLYPQEVFEMIRIVKSVGDLPNVGYVLALDSSYIADALATLGVPSSGAYLDKVIQIRMPVPGLSSAAREMLITDLLNELPAEALREYFPDAEYAIGSLYRSGLRELLDKPRDFNRVFNAVSGFEPQLRGEIAFADILAFSALMVKCDAVYRLLVKSPDYFVGRMDSDEFTMVKSAEHVGSKKDQRESAYAKCERPEAARRIIHFLFPLVAKSEEGSHWATSRTTVSGRIANRGRLKVILQASVGVQDVSLNQVSEYIRESSSRGKIESDLQEGVVRSFLELVGDLAEQSTEIEVSERGALCIHLAELADKPVVANIKRTSADVFLLSGRQVLYRAILQVSSKLSEKDARELAEKIAGNESSLSIASEIVVGSHFPSPDVESPLCISKKRLNPVTKKFGKNVVKAQADGMFFGCAAPDLILRALARLCKPRAKDFFRLAAQSNEFLDRFAEKYFRYSFDSNGGQVFAMPDKKDELQAFSSLKTLRGIAKRRLNDKTMGYPARAAWRAFYEQKKLYQNGDEARN